MTVLEEKRNKVIKNIQNTNDEFLLDFISEITELNPTLNEINNVDYIDDKNELNSELVNPIIIQLIEKAEKQIENGEYYTHSEVKGIVNTWM